MAKNFGLMSDEEYERYRKQYNKNVKEWNEENKKQRKQQTQRIDKQRREFVTEAPPPARSALEELTGVAKSLGKDRMRRIERQWNMLNPFDDINVQEARRKYMEDTRQDLLSNEQEWKDTRNFVESYTDSLSFGLFGDHEHMEGGAAGTTGSILGSFTPAGAIGGGLRALGWGAKLARNTKLGKRILETAKEGALAGGAYSTLEALGTEITTPEERDIVDHVKNIAVETGLGAVADPIINEALGKALGWYRRGNMNADQAKKYVEEQIQVGVGPERFTDDLLNVTNPEAVTSRANQALDEVLGMRTSTADYTPRNLEFDVNHNTLRRIPNTMELDTLGERGWTTPPPHRDIASTQHNYQAELPRQPEVAGLLEDMGGVDPRVRSAEEQLNQIEEMLNVRQREYVDENYSRFEEPLQRSAEADMMWEDAKNARQRLDEINRTLGRNSVKIPDDFLEEWGSRLPRNLRAGRNRTDAPYDMYTAAGELGYESSPEGVEQMLNELESLRERASLRRKDITPDDYIAPKDYAKLEDNLADEFRQSEEYRSTQQIADTLRQQIDEIVNPRTTTKQTRIRTTPPRPEDTTDFAMRNRNELMNQETSLDANHQRFEEYKNTFPESDVDPAEDIINIFDIKAEGDMPSSQMNLFRAMNDPSDPLTQTLTRRTNIPTPPSSAQGTGTGTGQQRDRDIINLRRKRKQQVPQTVKGVSKALESFKFNWIDDLAPIRRVEDQIRGLKKRDGGGEVYQGMRNVRKAFSASEVRTQGKLVEMQDKVIKSGENLDDVWRYATARHLIEVSESRGRRIDTEFREWLSENPNATQKQINNKMASLQKQHGYKLPDGYTHQELIDEYITPYENNPVYNEFLEDYRNNFSSYAVDTLHEAGLINEDVARFMAEEYPNYMPKFKSEELDDPNIFLDKFIGGLGERKPLHQLEGGSDDWIDNPIENIAKYMANVETAAARNKAYRDMVDLLDGQELNGVPLIKEIDASSFRRDANHIRVFVDGEPKFYQITPDLHRSIKELETQINPDGIARLAMNVSNFMRRSITANPAFAVRQLTRDLGEAYVYGDFSLWRDLAPAIMDSVTGGKFNPDMYNQFYNSGAGSASIFASDRTYNKAQRQLRNNTQGRNVKDITLDRSSQLFGKIMDKFMAFNQGAENIGKMAQFRATMRKTNGDVDRAAYEAADIMDYQMAGRMARQFNRYVGFFNVNIRGKERMVRALRERPIETLSKMAVVGAFPSYLAHLAYHTWANDQQRKRIDEAYQYEEDTYWLFPSPFSDDQIIRIGKPYEVAILASTPYEWYLKQQRGQELDWEAERKEWFAQMAIDASLTALTPAYEFATGQDVFRDAPIVPQREQDLDPIEQYDVNTPSSARAIAGLFDSIGLDQSKLASPRMINHLMEGYSPISSEFVNNIIDRGLEHLGIRENERPAREGLEAMANALIPQLDDTYQTSSLVGNLYDTRDKLEKERKKYGEDYKADQYTVINKAIKRDGDFAAMIREIDNDPSLSRSEKFEQRTELIEQRNEFARQVDEMLKSGKEPDFDKGFEDELIRNLYTPQEIIRNSDKLKREMPTIYSMLNKAEANEIDVEEINELILEEGPDKVERKAQELLLDPEELILSDDPIAESYRNLYSIKEIMTNSKSLFLDNGREFPYPRVQTYFNRAYRDVEDIKRDIRSIEDDNNIPEDEKGSLIMSLEIRKELAEQNVWQLVEESARIGLSNMNARLKGQVREQRKNTDRITVAQFTRAGVPEYEVKRILNSDMSKEQQERELRNLLNRYQTSN